MQNFKFFTKSAISFINDDRGSTRVLKCIKSFLKSGRRCVNFLHSGRVTHKCITCSANLYIFRAFTRDHCSDFKIIYEILLLLPSQNITLKNKHLDNSIDSSIKYKNFIMFPVIYSDYQKTLH